MAGKGRTTYKVYTLKPANCIHTMRKHRQSIIISVEFSGSQKTENTL